MSFRDLKIDAFTDQLASKEAVPGGGGASALVASIGMALGHMVGSLTIGKKKYADVEEDMKQWMNEAKLLQSILLEGMDADAEAFLPLSKAYGIPKDHPKRAEIMEEALKAACAAPFDLMKNICKALDLMKNFADYGSKLAISDAGVGAVCCKAALQGASLNIFINTKSMADREYAKNIETQTNRMLNQYGQLADDIYQIVLDKIK